MTSFCRAPSTSKNGAMSLVRTERYDIPVEAGSFTMDLSDLRKAEENIVEDFERG